MKTIQKSAVLFALLLINLISVSYTFSQSLRGAISDTAFIRKNMMDNMMEIQMLELGREKGDNDLKKVARQMLGDHYQMLEDMRKIGNKKDMPNMNVNSDGTVAGNNVAPTGTPDTITAAVNGIASTTPVTSASGTTGMDNSGSRVGTSATPSPGSPMATTPTAKTGMQKMSGIEELENATGAAFASKWVMHMNGMHKAKLSELQSASRRIKDADLLEAVNKAIPKIKSHIEMLATLGTSNQ